MTLNRFSMSVHAFPCIQVRDLKSKIFFFFLSFAFFTDTNPFFIAVTSTKTRGAFFPLLLLLSLSASKVFNDRLLRHFPSLSCSFVFLHDTKLSQSVSHSPLFFLLSLSLSHSPVLFYKKN